MNFEPNENILRRSIVESYYQLEEKMPDEEFIECIRKLIIESRNSPAKLTIPEFQLDNNPKNQQSLETKVSIRASIYYDLYIDGLI